MIIDDIELVLGHGPGTSASINGADVSFERKLTTVEITITRPEDEDHIKFTIPTDILREAMVRVRTKWWDIAYLDAKDGSGGKATYNFKCQATCEQDARDQWAECCPGSEILEVYSCDLEPRTLWRRRKPESSAPVTYVIHRSESSQVSVYPMGGGMQETFLLGTFLVEFERCDAMVPTARLAFFSLEWGPTIVGFSMGEPGQDRWNGWGQPFLEEKSFREWCAQMEPSLFTFEEDGRVKLDTDPNDEYSGDKRVEYIQPEQIEFGGEYYNVYDVGCALCWWQYDDPSELTGQEYADCMKAVVPVGMGQPKNIEAFKFTRDE